MSAIDAVKVYIEQSFLDFCFYSAYASILIYYRSFIGRLPLRLQI